jgi:hypothetical protein
MHKYRNKNPFSVVLDLSSGRKSVGSNQEFETLDEVTVPGIVKLSSTVEKQETKTEAKQNGPVFGSSNKIDISTELTKRFQSRFGIN